MKNLKNEELKLLLLGPSLPISAVIFYFVINSIFDYYKPAYGYNLFFCMNVIIALMLLELTRFLQDPLFKAALLQTAIVFAAAAFFPMFDMTYDPSGSYLAPLFIMAGFGISVTAAIIIGGGIYAYLTHISQKYWALFGVVVIMLPIILFFLAHVVRACLS